MADHHLKMALRLCRLDVRNGSAFPHIKVALCFGLCPSFANNTNGRSPAIILRVTERRSHSVHRAAEPRKEASKDDEVVEYALSRSLSPALIAEYQTQLPDKKLLQAKLHEFYEQAAAMQEKAAKKRGQK
jgi:hypothetical protein